MVEIRSAQLNDATEIRLSAQVLEYEELDLQSAKMKLNDILLQPNNWVYVACVNNQVVGWLHIFYAHRLASSNFFEIGGMAVHTNSQRKGIGRALVDHVKQIHGGPLRVRCNQIRTQTHHFYQSVGFEKTKGQLVFSC